MLLAYLSEKANYRRKNHLKRENTAISIPKASPSIFKSLMINGKLGTTKLIAVNTKKILIYSGTIKLFNHCNSFGDT